MEAERQRLYSFLTRTDLLEKMTKENEQISEIFSLSRSDATVILTHFRWNSIHVSDRISDDDDKEKLLSKLGLVQGFDSIEEEESISSCVNHEDGDGLLVSTPFCSHKYCTTCWREHLTESFVEEEKRLLLCPNPNCFASVGPNTIEKLTESVKEMYESYILESFMKSNKESIKRCPASGCDIAIELAENVDDDDGFDVVCLCGYTFCWRCQHESHRPLSCDNASLWLMKLLDQSRSLRWISVNTKPCPNCNSLVQKYGHYAFVTCACSCRFCYVCLRSVEEHEEIWNCVKASGSLLSNESALIHHLSLWEADLKAVEEARTEEKDIEENMIPKLSKSLCLGELDIRALREAWTVVVQCRLVLKWSSVFGYFISAAKKQSLDQCREEAKWILMKHKESVKELVNRAISAGDFTFFRHKVETTTANTGNHFHYFVKTLESGLSDVKVDAYENAAPCG